MAATREIIFDRLVYSCAFEKHRGSEEFYPDHFLGFQLAGETHAFHEQGFTIIRENMVVLVRKNQLVRTIKYPSKSGKYNFIAITLDKECLRRYAFENKIVIESPYGGKQKLFFEPNEFLSSYFISLAPYINKTKQATPRLADIKVREAIELLLDSNPDLKYILFDFTEAYKIDLEEFMNNNYMFNVPIESFAKLTGRSISAFKRDFAELFHCSPKLWLKNRRLEEAYYLIKYKQQKPTSFYLDIGFENLSHFYSSFKEKYGLTTSEI
ncbi:MAG: DNA-binding protein [Sphingobacterium sp.]|jgi:AraC-like DNA-binding protein|uniref:helix-turn-helix domain-containing protein n=1 Tax=unclassified Sphingobacterium TaxID=2609468 RepID=UPI000985074E|nr:AraC family transcriptional regulator [Sphingobacterium sp. CZ-UAM]MDF2515475.1 DNA-binding protein [Sphingobacterium sp.]OOG16114.1 AraC family transcriptional regulator [Sphingobacterium sp. CZ-UAM]